VQEKQKDKGTRTCDSKNDTKASFPTRGVPKVTDLTTLPAGKFSLRKSVSSSASAPPSECPTYID
jgi:hypothetical protein